MSANDIRKYSVRIEGHPTSVSLEPVFWEALQTKAREKGCSVNSLVSEIDAAREGNLSSAIRIYLFEQVGGQKSSP